MPTIQAGRPVKVMVEVTGGNGEWAEASGSAKRLPGQGAKLFTDRTDAPHPTVHTSPSSYVLQPANAEPESKDKTKPPYGVPGMAEINRIKPNGFTVVSTFAGCGGSSLGYRMAGFRVLWANEFITAAQESYRANARPETIIDGRDIREVTADEILAAIGLDVGELDVFDGSPPCVSFSTAGRREKGWGKQKLVSGEKWSRPDDLFYEYARLLKGLQPRTFVAENVSGLIKGTAKGQFIRILGALKACGYRVEAKLLDAQWLGVPQQRQRIIFIGVRNDLGALPAFPLPLPYRYSIREALPWLDGAGTSKGIVPGEEPAPTVMTHGRRNTQSELTAARIVQGDSVDFKNKGRGIDAGKPAPAIAAGNSAKRTPSQLYIEESAVVPTGKAGRRRRENGKPYGLDEPIATVAAQKGHGYTQFAVEYRGQQSGGKFGKRTRSIDEPSPAVNAEGLGSAARHQVQITLGGGNTKPNKPGNSFPRNVRLKLGEPAPAIMAGGIGGVGADQCEIRAPKVFATGNQNFKRTRRSIDLPSGTVTRAPERKGVGDLEFVEPESDIGRYEIGREWDKLKPGEQSERYFSLVRSDPEKPVVAVTAAPAFAPSAAGVTHPFERRRFSIAELRRLCGFPDDFVLTGTYAQQWERLGNSVPPVMMFHIAKAVLGVLRESSSRKNNGRSRTSSRKPKRSARGTKKVRASKAGADNGNNRGSRIS